MDNQKRIFESESLVMPSFSLRSTQTLEEKLDAEDVQKAEKVFNILSEELIAEIIERIKSL